MAKSNLSTAFYNQLKMLSLPLPLREYKFHDVRRWRFDFSWPDRRIAVEIEGGTWVNGGHNRGKTYWDNCQKYNEAQRLGWQVYRFTTDDIKRWQAAEYMKQILLGGTIESR